MVYVDDLLFTGEEPEINRIFEQIQQHMLLRPTGESTPGSTVSFLGRQITNRGNYYEITLGDSYIDNILQEAQLETCNPATTPGATTTKETVEDEELLNVEQHKQYRRMVGKLQWLSYTRPDMAYATKELARGLQQPTVKHQKKLKHLIRYLKGTKHYKFCISPTVQLRDDNMPLDVVASTDSDWAGCHSTRKSTTGFAIQVLGTTVHFGSRTQATVALSSAESEFYAIGTATTEALFLKNFLQEILGNRKINIKVGTDSSSGKSMATRIGVSRRAKHIDLRFMFIQQLVHAGAVTLLKIPTALNIADILTKYVTKDVLSKHLYNIGMQCQHRQQ